MKWELDDNSRSGLHYLGLGLLVVLVVRLLWWAVFALAYHDITEEEAVLRAGYLGLGSWNTVVASTSAGERVITGLMIAAGTAILLAIPVSFLFRADRITAFRRFALVIFLPCAIWTTACALFVPVKYAEFHNDHVTVHYRRALIADLPIPFLGGERALRREELQGLRVMEANSDGQAAMEILLAVPSGEEIIGRVPFPRHMSSAARQTKMERIEGDLLAVTHLPLHRAERSEH